jgi:hypothetical protein
MKKLLLTVCFLSLAAMYGYSQLSLALSDSSGSLPNNSTISKTGLPTSPEIVAYVNVTNTSGKTITVKAKKVQISLTDPAYVTFCWAGGCYPPTTFVSPSGTPMAAGTTNTEFSGHYTPESVSGMAIIRYVFFDEANPNDSVCVNVNYSAFPLGVEETAATAGLSNAYPNPATGMVTIAYSVPAGSTSTLLIRNILGATVKSEILTGTSGKVTINTADLSDGIYFYSLLVNGEAAVTKKLVVRN